MDAASIALFTNAGSAIIALMFAGTLYTVVSPLLDGDKQKKRMKSVTSERDSLRRTRLDQLQKGNSLRSNDAGLVKRIVDGLSLEKLLAAPQLREKLMQAGYRGTRPMQTFYFFRLAGPIILFIFGIFYFVILNPRDWPFSRSIFAAISSALLGYYSPGIFIKNAANKRMAKIMPSFPDALDLLLICVESGMSIEMAFARVSGEMASTSIELAEEMSLTTAELSYLPNRQQAYENLARRNNHPGIRSVSTALIQSERYGTPLGATLRTMANENREIRMLEAEKRRLRPCQRN